ncbi:MAG TPA: hypothetical protein VNT77_01070 [Allosphingosinicella sp.]|nr:hypothetical protein [Allosphingosinicella sp.]
MAMSRITLLLILTGSPAAAQPVTAEQAIEKYRESFKPVEIECAKEADPDVITVCGSRDSSNRYRVPYQPDPGEPEHLAPGEAPQASTSVGACLSRCPQPVSVNILEAVPAVLKGIRKILDPDS